MQSRVRFSHREAVLWLTEDKVQRNQKNLNRFHMLFACANLLMLVRGGRTEQFCNA